MLDATALIESYQTQWKFIRWADNRMLIAAETVTDPVEYYKDRGISAGSLHKLLNHLVSGQAGWLKTWSEGSVDIPDASPIALSDFATIKKTWPIVHEAIAGYLANLKAADLVSPRQFLRREMQITLPLRDAITHMLDHCAYHRGHLNTLVKLAGGKRVWMSYWIYAMTLHPQASGATDSDFLFS